LTNYKKFDIIKGFYQIFLKIFAFYQKFCYNERIKAFAALNFGKIFVKNLLRRPDSGAEEFWMHIWPILAHSRACWNKIKKIYAVRTIRERMGSEERRT
jgi:hypothetical protein